jgi:hypothetical protein
MTTAMTTAGLFEAVRHGFEAHDYRSMEGAFATDAVLVTYSVRRPPASAPPVTGWDAILALWSDVPDDLRHEISDEVVGDDRFAFVLTCTYPNGGKVKGAYVCHSEAGLITRMVGVEAWDD